jgi:hypothetical protein
MFRPQKALYTCLRPARALCTAWLLVASPGVATAQPASSQVVQGADGTLYVVQGSNAWTLVPNQISPDDLAALTVNGEIDGTLPNNLLVVQTPAAAPAPVPPAAPAPVPPAAEQPPAAAPAPPPAPAAPAPITGSADLTGKAGSDLQSATLIGLGASITSIVDTHTKPNGVYAINLSGGHKYLILSSTNNKYGSSGIYAVVLNPDGSVANQNFVLGGYYIPGCWGPAGADTCSFTVAVDGTYYVKMQAQASGQNYTFSVKQTS